MNSPISRIDAKTLKALLHDGGEIALLDAREEVPYDQRHILMASCVPLGRLETIVDALVPRRSARVVWCDDSGKDDGAGLAESAAQRMVALGYRDVSFLEGGVAAWEAAGYRIYSGVHVPSKAFAEVIEHDAGTPYISAEQLKEMMDDGTDMALFDSRSFEEFHVNSIPTAVSVPGAELVYRFKDLVPSPETSVVVNCGGRTRSIIGAQALISAGFPNKVVSLMNGTQGWHLAGYEVIKGATKSVPEVSTNGLAAAQEAAERVAVRHGITTIDLATLGQWRKDADQRSLYVLDVRMHQEYEAGHLAGVKHIPGGQLIQETDRHLGTWGARVVLVDDVGVRATMTASWLKQMGWDVSVLRMDQAGSDLEGGPYAPRVLGLEETTPVSISATDLSEKLAAGTALVLDFDWSQKYYGGHIPGARYILRTRLAADITKLPKTEMIVLTSPDGALAHLAFAEAAAAISIPVTVLSGGTNAWKDAGLPLEEGATHMASEAVDIRLKAREQNQDMEEAMREYLAWEIELVNQMATDDDQRFQVVSD
jgi:rhodanese-related sulfurtransferase